MGDNLHVLHPFLLSGPRSHDFVTLILSLRRCLDRTRAIAGVAPFRLSCAWSYSYS